MQVFHGTVRLQGNLMNEVHKRGMTVPEIYALRRIHGNDAVAKLEHAGDALIDDMDERQRLADEYDPGLGALGDDQKTSIQKMFGDYAPLPTELHDYRGSLSKVQNELEFFRQPAPHSDKEEDEKLNRKNKPSAVAPKAVEAIM